MSEDNEANPCRICLEKNKPSTSLFEVISDYKQTSVNLLEELKFLQISESDSLPKMVCDSCVNKIQYCYEFKQLCQRSDDILKNSHSDENFSPETSDSKLEIQCLVCDDKFPSENHLMNHVTKHHSSNVYIKSDHESDVELEKNDKDSNINTSIDIKYHINDSNEDNTTEIISIIDDSNNASEENENKCTDNKLICLLCKKEFREKNLYWKHLPVSHPTNSILQRVEHINGTVKTIMSYYCRKCNIVFLKRDNFINHIQSSVSHCKFKCNYCKDEFNSSNSYNVHVKTYHQDQKGYRCGVCNATFPNKAHYNIHRKRHKKDSYLCQTCGKCFNESSNLAAHIRIHTGEKPFVCNICSKGFTQRSSLKVHQLMHSSERKYVCSYCGNKYKTRSGLREHNLRHTGEKNFECTVCNKKFYGSTELKIHIRTHTSERGFECTFCDKAFKQRKHLVVHIKTHTGEKNHVCPICNKGFVQRVVLRNHMKVHNKESKSQ